MRFSAPAAFEEEMTAKHEGELLSIAVLRGTPLKKAGERVSIGEKLVGGYSETPSGERVNVKPIARAEILCVYEAEIEAGSEEEALAFGTLHIDGEITSKECSPTEKGFFVRIAYIATETVNL